MSVMPSTATCTLAHYQGSDVARIVEAVLAVNPWAKHWLGRVKEPRFHVVTVSQYARIVGYLALTAADGHMTIVDHALAVQAQDRQRALDELVTAAIEAAESPWGDVIVSPDSELVSVLLGGGWQVSADHPYRFGGTLSFSGAGVQ